MESTVAASAWADRVKRQRPTISFLAAMRYLLPLLLLREGDVSQNYLPDPE